MGTLVGFISAFTLKFYQENESINWIFVVPICNSCIDRQLELMKEFAHPKDKVSICLSDDQDRNEIKQETDQLIVSIKNLEIELSIEVLANKHTMFGWLWSDPYSAEKILYSCGSNYDIRKSRELLSIIRKPN